MLSTLVACALLGASAPQDGTAAVERAPELPPVAARADEVRPLLPGSEIPAAQVLLPDGKPLDVAQFTAQGPSIVIFYRGGW